MLLPTPTPSEVADIVAINQLATAYCEAISRHAIEEAVLVYTDDGVLRSPTTPDTVGRAAIAALIEETISDMEHVFHCLHQGLVAVDGDTARGRFPLTEWSRRRSDGQTLMFLGVYSDELVRTPDGWRFSCRTLVPWTIGKPEGFTGKMHPLVGLAPQL